MTKCNSQTKYVETRKEWRQWLAKNHLSEQSVTLICKTKKIINN